LDDTPTIVHVNKSETKVRDVIQKALSNAGKVNETADDYELLEESIASHCSPSPIHEHNPSTSLTPDSFSSESIPMQRVLPLNEPILDSVAFWGGISRRLYLRKKANESGRAWITNIINKGGISNSTSPVFAHNRRTVTTDAGSSNSTRLAIKSIIL
jgi:hypothetical protein